MIEGWSVFLYHSTVVLGALYIVVHLIWIRAGVVRGLLTRTRIEGRQVVIIRPDVASVLRLSPGITIPCRMVTRILCSPRCVCIMAGPFLLAEIWLPPPLVTIVARRALGFFPLAQITTAECYVENTYTSPL